MHNKNLSVFMQTIGYDFKDISLLEVALLTVLMPMSRKKEIAVIMKEWNF